MVLFIFFLSGLRLHIALSVSHRRAGLLALVSPPVCYAAMSTARYSLTSPCLIYPVPLSSAPAPPMSSEHPVSCHTCARFLWCPVSTVTSAGSESGGAVDGFCLSPLTLFQVGPGRPAAPVCGTHRLPSQRTRCGRCYWRPALSRSQPG